EDTQLFLRGSVAAWLRGLDSASAPEQDGCALYPINGESSVIWVREAEWVSAVAGHQLEHPGEERLVFELQGRPGAGKKRFAQDVAGKLGRRLWVIRLAFVLEHSRQEGLDLLRRSCFACRVNGCIPYLELVHCTGQDAEALHWIESIVGEFPLVFIGSTPDQDLTCRLSVATQKLSLDRLSMEDNLALWRQVGSRYPVAEDVRYEQLAGKYRLLPAVISEVFVRAEQRRWERSMDRIDGALLLSCVRECNQRFENTLMERIHTVFRWEDLKVKPETVRSMQLACAHLKHRFAAQETLGSRYPYGTSVSVLMYGPPGTVKTMAAQVMANELQMDLCRVDLSQISSKYIGETEKNLEKVFREAEQSNVILFFDEADSLFGKRMEVKDSNDKYANQETSYILQRIESYDGMVILATNLARNFDPAFMRRITVSIQFDLPDVETRLLLWKDMLQNTELAGNETMLRNLAEQFELSGSNIKSAVRNAVFMALMEDRALSVADIAAAVKIEFEKMGKIANASSFGAFYCYIS
ncbi:MAG: ATP-binding protein, partial [Clostridia bacterium]|nr:ATP-binding protein [Clostridia bacterium]